MYNVRTSHAFNSLELFEGWDRKKNVRIDSKTFGQSTFRLCAAVFSYCIYLIINDIIKRKVSFKLPLADAFIEMTPIKGKAFSNLMSKGWFEGLDYLVSNFTAYMLQYRDETNKKGVYNKFIYTDGSFKKDILERTNAGEKW